MSTRAVCACDLASLRTRDNSETKVCRCLAEAVRNPRRIRERPPVSAAPPCASARCIRTPRLSRSTRETLFDTFSYPCTARTRRNFDRTPRTLLSNSPPEPCRRLRWAPRRHQDVRTCILPTARTRRGTTSHTTLVSSHHPRSDTARTAAASASRVRTLDRANARPSAQS